MFNFLNINNKGDERMLIFYWLMIFVVVGVSVSVGVILFFNGPIDVRLVEADALNDRVIDCLIERGHLKYEFFNDSFSEELEDYCGIVLDEQEFFVEVKTYHFYDCDFSSDPNARTCPDSAFVRSLFVGNEDFRTACQLEGDKFPKCVKKNVFALNATDGSPFLVEVVSGVAKINKNVLT